MTSYSAGWIRPGLMLMVTSVLSSLPAFAVEISETEYEGRSQFLIRSRDATWYYDRAGGGFSRLIDRDGHDWIAFRKEPLSEYPASAAAGFRGIPNAVFVGPDKGAGHPGFDKCESVLTGTSEISTTSRSGKWKWTWSFTEQAATFTMDRADSEHRWWFLYEGPIAGSFSPHQKFWGSDRGGPRREVPDSRSQRFAKWRWVYFGDARVSRTLFVAQHQTDELPDTLWYLGNSDRGSTASPDGMVVFGFGRGAGATPRLTGAGHRFTVGLIEGPVADASDHGRLTSYIEAAMSDSPEG